MKGYDSVLPGLIPAAASVIFPYADGRFAWTPAALARFPKAARRFITVTGNGAIANICDVERGDVTPDGAAAFIRSWDRHHPASAVPATIYCSRDTLAAVERACAGLRFRVWLATLDGTMPREYGGRELLGVQYRTKPGAYDETMIWNEDWPWKP